MLSCKICSKKINKKLSFSNLPVSNFFSKSKNKGIKNFEVYLCSNCKFIQVKNNFKQKDIQPSLKFIKQREPEDHLDKIAKNLDNLFDDKLKKKINILGISYKDQSLIKRLKRIGYRNAKILRYSSLNKNNVSNIFENIEFEFSENFSKIKKKYSSQDLIISRHLLEHLDETSTFLNKIKQLSRNRNSYIYLEIPDSKKPLDNFDYGMFWEQHRSYFLKKNFLSYLNLNNIKKIKYTSYNYNYENCLLFIGKFNTEKILKKKSYFTKQNNTYRYFKKFRIVKKKINNGIRAFKNERKKIAIFGCGHQSVLLCHIFGINKFIDFYFDNNKNLQGYNFPGTSSKIHNPYKYSKSVDICLTCANYSNEEKIRKKNKNIFKTYPKFISLIMTNKKGIKKFL
tara:strand:- start:1553 stop:2743 length:1191 start_codon:yes stop_codon:yes gene_type:complete